MSIIKWKVGDLCKVSPKSDEVYRISWIGEQCICQIEAKKHNAGWYSPQNFDTSLLVKI